MNSKWGFVRNHDRARASLLTHMWYWHACPARKMKHLKCINAVRFLPRFIKDTSSCILMFLSGRTRGHVAWWYPRRNEVEGRIKLHGETFSFDLAERHEGGWASIWSIYHLQLWAPVIHSGHKHTLNLKAIWTVSCFTVGQGKGHKLLVLSRF